MKKEIRGFIFDVDGTLLDSMPVWRNCADIYLASKGRTPRPDLGENLFTKSMKEGSVYLKEAYDLSDTPEQVLAGLIGVVEHAYQEEIPMKPGMRDLIERYHNAGCPMVLATTGNGALDEAAFKRLGVWTYFDGLFEASKYNTSKREPNLFYMAAEKLGMAPAEIAVYEDSIYAVRTAKAAGFYVVAVHDADNMSDWGEMCELADEIFGE